MTPATKAAIEAVLPPQGAVPLATFRDLMTGSERVSLVLATRHFVPVLLPDNVLGYDADDLRAWLASVTDADASA